MNNPKHIPVMLNEVLSALAPKDDETYVDATSATAATAKPCWAANRRVIAIDRDPNVADRAAELKRNYGTRFDFRPGCFGAVDTLVTEEVDGIVF